MRVFVRPCNVNRLQSTSPENSYRGPTRGLFELIFFTHIPGEMGYVLAIFKFFLSALRSIKNYVNVTPSSSPDFLTIQYTVEPLKTRTDCIMSTQTLLYIFQHIQYWYFIYSWEVKRKIMDP